MILRRLLCSGSRGASCSWWQRRMWGAAAAALTRCKRTVASQVFCVHCHHLCLSLGVCLLIRRSASPCIFLRYLSRSIKLSVYLSVSICKGNFIRLFIHLLHWHTFTIFGEKTRIAFLGDLLAVQTDPANQHWFDKTTDYWSICFFTRSPIRKLSAVKKAFAAYNVALNGLSGDGSHSLRARHYSLSRVKAVTVGI